jgi:cystathionine beta-lyase/cystathionine gamma-synthase
MLAKILIRKLGCVFFCFVHVIVCCFGLTASLQAVMPPIILASTFAQAQAGKPSGMQLDSSFGKGFEYSRTGNPTRGTWERCIAASEGGKFGLAFSSGMAAITACNHLIGHGAHVISSDDVCT